MAGFDTHVHSTASDGVLHPAELVKRAQQCGLLGMALTDHDTVDGLAEAMAAGQELGFPVITGIEFSSEIYERDVHILGYWIDAAKLRADGRLAALQQSRIRRIYEMVRRLRILGQKAESIRSGGNHPCGRRRACARASGLRRARRPIAAVDQRRNLWH